MPEPTNDSAAIERAADAKAEWCAPQLTVLGDMRSLTEAGGAVIPEGGGNSHS